VILEEPQTATAALASAFEASTSLLEIKVFFLDKLLFFMTFV